MFNSLPSTSLTPSVPPSPDPAHGLPVDSDILHVVSATEPQPLPYLGRGELPLAVHSLPPPPGWTQWPLSALPLPSNVLLQRSGCHNCLLLHCSHCVLECEDTQQVHCSQYNCRQRERRWPCLLHCLGFISGLVSIAFFTLFATLCIHIYRCITFGRAVVMVTKPQCIYSSHGYCLGHTSYVPLCISKYCLWSFHARGQAASYPYTCSY